MKSTLTQLIVSFCLPLAMLMVRMATAETISNLVSHYEFRLAAGQTVAVAFPLAAARAADSTVARDALSRAAGDGDLLHLWQGKHFISYEYAAGLGDWRILETVVPMPAARLKHQSDQGYLVSRQATGEGVLAFHGAPPDDAMLELTIPATSWRLVGSPFPAVLGLPSLTAAGAQEGDRVRIWQPEIGLWQIFELTNSGWQGDGSAATVEIGIGRAFLYYNSSASARHLRFERPYPLATRP